ncbi:hypothetical protein A8C32_18160 [Flavivirga aquatica]|uniref:Uncharacterized protein n=1 Tax=Flavivirga aquatica TaxID=1849968 RepID=A0A1E5T7K6_9FLAO|nr:hypothetical protein [Flavivirga aquatica]OEK07361.1 hypothetical protein A8C32_18160 [Flavivirga aquatica]
MKAINFIIMLFCTINLSAQTMSWSIADVVVGGEKTVITAALGTELSLRKAQGKLIKELEEAEENYNSKREIKANFKSSFIIIAAVQTQIINLNKKIENINSNISVLKIASFGVGHGLSRYKAALDTEQKYLQKINEENLLVGGTGFFVSGGTGHLYTAYLKLLLRIIPIKNEILKIEKEIKAKMTVTKIFQK